VRPHQQVRVPEATGLSAVRANASGERGEVVDHLRLCRFEQPLGFVPAREIVFGPPRHERVMSVVAEALDEVRAEESGTAGDERLHEAIAPGLYALNETASTCCSDAGAPSARFSRRASGIDTGPRVFGSTA